MDRLVQDKSADVERLLSELPQDVNGLYSSILQCSLKVAKLQPEIQRLILQFVTHSIQPIQLLQLAECLRITEPDVFAIMDMASVQEKIRSSCGPLLDFYPSGVIGVIHPSFIEFLTDKTRPLSGGAVTFPRLDYGEAHQVIARKCLTYVDSFGLSEVIPTKERKGVGQDGKLIYHDFWCLPMELSAFSRYCNANWFIHVQRAEAAGAALSQLVFLLDKLMAGDNLPKLFAMAPRPIRREVRITADPLFVALTYGLTHYSKLIIQRPDYVSPGDTTIPVLAYAAELGNIEIVKTQMKHVKGIRVDEFDSRVLIGKTALHYAAVKNHAKIARLLLDVGANPHLSTISRDPSLRGPPEALYRSAIKAACELGNLEVLQELVPEISTSDDMNKAMAWAVTSGCPHVVEFLASQPLLQVNEQIHDMTPLMLASMYRLSSCIRFLLDAGADATVASSPEAGNEMGYSEPGMMALHIWAKSDITSFYNPKPRSEKPDAVASFDLLIGAGAGINARDGQGHPPLYYAHTLETAKTLVEAGADCNGFVFYPNLAP
jgi:ankyrin repeat protein